MILTLMAAGCALAYAILLGYYKLHWHKTPTSHPRDQKLPPAGASVIIVARNEGLTIRACLRGILSQDYPSDRFEIILIDDHSTDNTVREAQELHDPRIRIFSLADFPDYIHPPAYKKSGIVLAADQARFDLLVVTDADCTHGPYWLNAITRAFDDSHVQFQTAPVLLNAGSNLLQKMQEMEQLTLMLITGAGITSGLHTMANGANMVFRKSAFREVGDYSGNWSYASGDDMFLAEKMKDRFPDGIAFAKSIEAVVWTDAKPDWQALLRQRIRWAGKNKGLHHRTISYIWMFVGAYQLMLVLAILAAMLHLTSWWTVLMLWLTKWLADGIIVYTASTFFNRKGLMSYFIPLQVIYLWYILMLGVKMIAGGKSDWERA